MYYVYMLLSKDNLKHTYVGYTNNLIKRVKLHNTGNGAKFTRGRSWKVIYKKKFDKKSKAIKEEYNLKKNYKLRKKIKEKYL
ncbi:MAG: GIY-YIG nuclease family protein [Pelagibacteraceae bacterium]|jgi:putative endonuclease